MFGMGKKIDPSGITEEIKKGSAVLIDVRSDDEWRLGHAQNAMHVSVERIINGELPVKDKHTKLYLYCASGGRAGTAANFLKSNGYEAENLGGLNDWSKAGGEVE